MPVESCRDVVASSAAGVLNCLHRTRGRPGDDAVGQPQRGVDAADHFGGRGDLGRRLRLPGGQLA